MHQAPGCRQCARASFFHLTESASLLVRPRAKLLFMRSQQKKSDSEGGRARRFLNFGDSYTCTYCLQEIKWDHHRTRPTRDHFFPRSKKKLLMGAKTTFIVCCQPCNSRKSDKVFTSIEEVREFMTSRKKAQH